MTELIITNTNTNALTINMQTDNLIALWIDSKARLSNSKETVKSYSIAVMDFSSFCVDNAATLTSAPHIVATLVQAWLSLKNWSSSSVKMKLAILSSFYAFLVKRGIYGSNPIDLLDRPKISVYGKSRTIQSSKVQSKARQLSTGETLEDIRDCAMIALFSLTGKRLSEIGNLTISDIEQSNNSYILTFSRTKGGKNAKVSIKGKAAVALQRWLEEREAIAKDDNLWLSFSHKTYGKALSIRGIQSIIRERLDTNPHSLRSSFAITMLKAGADIDQIRQQLGHSSAATTAIYLQSLTTKENEFYDKIEDQML